MSRVSPYAPPAPAESAPSSYRYPWFDIAAFGYPAVVIGSFYGLFVLAAAELGHWPRPYLDDPKGLGGLVGLLYYVPGMLLIASPAMALGGFVYQMLARGRRWKERCLRAVLLLSVWVGTFVLIRVDPVHVFDWYMD